MHRLLITVASRVEEHEALSVRASAAETQGGPAVGAHGLRCSEACESSGQGLNPCSLHIAGDSYPLGHLGSPDIKIKI